MADWNLPLASSLYVDVLNYLKQRDIDAISLSFSSITNTPEHAFKYERTLNLFQEWEGGIWNNKVLAIAGGGTGATTPPQAITNLGLGSMALQAASNVVITGGTLNGVAITNSTAQLIGGSITGMSSISAAVLIGDGAGITNLNASNLATGLVNPALLGPTPSPKLLLHGNSVWSNLLDAVEAKGYAETLNTVAIAAGVATIDLSLGNNILILLTENITSIVFTNIAASGLSQGMLLELRQDGTGNRTVAGWPASVTFGSGVAAPIISPTANRSDFITLWTRDNGARISAFVAGQNYL